MSRPSGLLQTWGVVFADDTALIAHVEMRDATAWERTFKRGWFDSDRPSLAMVSWRCWHALRRQGDYTDGFPTFDGQVVDLQLLSPDGTPQKEDEETEPVPTPHADGDGSSSPLPSEPAYPSGNGSLETQRTS